MTREQLQTIADLVAIAHDEYDGLQSYRDDLERFDRVLAEIKAEAHSAPGNAAAMRATIERIREIGQRMPQIEFDERVPEIIAECDRVLFEASAQPETTGDSAAMREALAEILDRTNREKERDYDAALNGGILEIHDIANTALNQTKGE